MQDGPTKYQLIKDGWESLTSMATRTDAAGIKGPSVQASNTYSATLTTSFLVAGAVTDLQNRWAPIQAFTIDFDPDAYKPKAVAQVKHVTAGPTVQTNATNFESGDATVTNIAVTPAQITASFNISNADLQGGLRMENLNTIALANLSNKLIELATAPMTTANFPGPLVCGAPAFGFSELATLQASLKKAPTKNLILDGSYLARISNTPGFFQKPGTVSGGANGWQGFGWDGIYHNTDWTGAGANVQGIACAPQAITAVFGLPASPGNIPGGILERTVFTVPGLNVQVALFAWFNPATRVSWMSYDAICGFTATGDTNSGFLITSA
jgi:hypothetical protein